jgi:membrane protein implicated in regulation of membrane protease activity
MRSVIAFLSGLLIGDDWTSFAGIVAALGLTAVLTTLGIPAWWLMPLAVPVVLTLSLGRAVRRRDTPPASSQPPPPGRRS